MVGFLVQVGSSSAHFLSHAESSIPHGAGWTIASEGVDIPFFASLAGVDFKTGVPVPSGAEGTVAELGVGVVDSAEGTVEAY